MWFSVLLYIATLIVVLVYIYNYVTYKPPNFPNGPMRLPIVGSHLESILRDWNFPTVAVEKWRKLYGDIFGFFLGPFLCMYVCDYDSVKEALVKVEFDGKPPIFTAKARSYGKLLGLFFTDGKFWHEQRRFSLRHMRDFGFGRRFQKLELLMQKELEQLVEFIKYPTSTPSKNEDIYQDGSILFPDMLYPTMMNAVMSIFGMEPAPADSKEYRHFRDIGRSVMQLQCGLHAMGSLTFLPWMRFLMPDSIGYTNIMKSNSKLFPFIKNFINDIKAKADEDEIKSFVDLYVKKMKEQGGEEFSSFSDEQLEILVLDYMFPAVTAVPAIIVYLLQYFLLYPHIQERVQSEIDDIVGHGRLPTLDDRIHLPYTEATIREILRIETLTPIGIPHRCTKDTEFKNYTIPQDTIVYTYIEGAHMDKKIWKDPEAFMPERFIDHLGRLKKKDYSLPFGAGKRLCAGETFARNSIFLITACLAQNFTFLPKDGDSLPNLAEKNAGVARTAKNGCWVKAVPRE